MNVRIETTKEGEHKVNVNGIQVTWPEPGHALVLSPGDHFHTRLEYSSDKAAKMETT